MSLLSGAGWQSWGFTAGSLYLLPSLPPSRSSPSIHREALKLRSAHFGVGFVFFFSRILGGLFLPRVAGGVGIFLPRRCGSSASPWMDGNVLGLFCLCRSSNINLFVVIPRGSPVLKGELCRRIIEKMLVKQNLGDGGKKKFKFFPKKICSWDLPSLDRPQCYWSGGLGSDTAWPGLHKEKK